MKFQPQPPPLEVIERLIARHAITAGVDASGTAREGERHRDDDGSGVELIVMRGFGAPAPWTRAVGHASSKTRDALIRLLTMPPDQFITPTLAIYRD